MVDTNTARAQRRRLMPRQVLATVAGLSVAATVLTLVALPSSGAKHPAIKLPTAQAANAAYELGLASAKPATVAGVSVAIKDDMFMPTSLAIKAGTTVTWTNDDSVPHTVTVTSGPVKFGSPTLQKGDTYSFTFTKAGTYSYYCAVHPSMTAKVVVAGTTPTPTPTPTTSTPTPTPTTSTPTTTPPSGDSECAVSNALQTFLSHLNAAHLSESPGQQVQDILDIDSYIGNHLVLVEHMLAPLTDGGLSTALSSLLSTFLGHVNTAHLDESPGQQAQDILDINSYIGNHLALVQHMLESSEALAC